MDVSALQKKKQSSNELFEFTVFDFRRFHCIDIYFVFQVWQLCNATNAHLSVQPRKAAPFRNFSILLRVHKTAKRFPRTTMIYNQSEWDILFFIIYFSLFFFPFFFLFLCLHFCHNICPYFICTCNDVFYNSLSFSHFTN